MSARAESAICRLVPVPPRIENVELPTLADLKARAERGRRILGTASVDENNDSQVAGADGIEDLEGTDEVASVEPEADRVRDQLSQAVE